MHRHPLATLRLGYPLPIFPYEFHSQQCYNEAWSHAFQLNYSAPRASSTAANQS
jgi:hypothetical protein